MNQTKNYIVLLKMKITSSHFQIIVI